MMTNFLLLLLYLVLHINTQIELIRADCAVHLPAVDNISTRYQLKPNNMKSQDGDICSIFFVSRLHECSVLCNTQGDCVSFTYDKARHVCSLHNGTSENLPEDNTRQVVSSTMFYYESLSTRVVSFS